MSASIGEEIRAARVGRTQTEVAAAAGLTKSYLCDIEKGYRKPPPETLKRLAAVLNVSADRWLWMWVEDQMGLENAYRAACYAARTL